MSIRVYGVNLGHVGLDIEHLMWDHPRYMLLPEEREKQKVWYQMPTNAYVVEHPQGRILFETGVSPDWRQEWPDAYKGLAAWSDIDDDEFLGPKLEELGLAPDDFRYVVAGHLHIDHSGGIRLFEGSTAELVVHAREMQTITSLEEDGAAYCLADVRAVPRMRPWVVEGNTEILPGVELISLPGHCAGLMGMLVHTENSGTILLASDSIYHHEAYGPPPVGTGVTALPSEWADSAAKVHRLARRHEALVVPGHSTVGVRQHGDGRTEFEDVRFGPENAYE